MPMLLSPLDDISFDSDDANLFQVDDARLRADALKHSVLPRLRVVMNTAVALIREVYGIDALEDSIFSQYPNFREKRYKNELTFLYDSVFVGLGGQRKPKWPGFSRKDGKPVQILPFRFAFMLTADGVEASLENGWLKGLGKKSFGAILQFHLDNEEIVNRLCFAARIRPDFYRAEDLPFFATFREHYRHRLEYGEIENHFLGYPYKFPVEPLDLYSIVHDFTMFFPVYDAYLQIAKGEPSRLTELVDRLTTFEPEKHPDIYGDIGDDGEAGDASDTDADLTADEATRRARDAAASKIPVMPAMRWQVFQRDGWKCVACGRTSHDGAILHVDHIVPRSKGGPDTLENFQTLCETCNIGKSNRNDTDLRKRD